MTRVIDNRRSDLMSYTLFGRVLRTLVPRGSLYSLTTREVGPAPTATRTPDTLPVTPFLDGLRVHKYFLWVPLLSPVV